MFVKPIKIKTEDIPKPRNHLAVAARKRFSGASQKPYKSQRQKDKVSLKADFNFINIQNASIT